MNTAICSFVIFFAWKYYAGNVDMQAVESRKRYTNGLVEISGSIERPEERRDKQATDGKNVHGN